MSEHQVSLTLPYPVTINHYYGFRGSQKFIKKKGKEYREDVERIVNEPYETPFNAVSFGGLIIVSVTIYPPDKRKRDVDNVLKCLLDALQHAGVFENDNQISKLVVERKGHLEGYEVVKGGRVEVLIEEYHN